MHYVVGDQPVGMAFPCPEEFDDIEVTSVTVLLDGAVQTVQSYSDETRTASVNANAPFLASGLVDVTAVVLFDGGSVTRELEPIVVEPLIRDGWHTLFSARRGWPDAPEDDEELSLLLTSAKSACLAYLGGRAVYAVDGAPVPVAPSSDWRRAQLLQARAIWQAGRVNRGTDAQLGFEGDTIQLFPLNADIRHLLVPKTRIPVIR